MFKDNIVYQTKNFKDFLKFIRLTLELEFVEWIDSHAGHELCKAKDGKLYEIKRSHVVLGTGNDRTLDTTHTVVTHQAA